MTATVYAPRSPTVASNLAFPQTRSRKAALSYDTVLYRQRHRIEVMFGRLKDWRRIAMRYDRFAHTFFAAITLATTVIFWLGQ
jgi:transposase